MSSNVDVPSKSVSAGRPWWLDLLLARGPGPWRSGPARVVTLLVIRPRVSELAHLEPRSCGPGAYQAASVPLAH